MLRNSGSLVSLIISVTVFVMSDAISSEDVAVPKLNEQINLNGKLTEAVWRKISAHPMAEVEPLNNAEKEIPPGCASSLKIWRTSDALYFGFRFEHPYSPMLKMEKRGRDSSVWDDECVELFFDVGGETAERQICINPFGNIYDSAGRNSSWNGKMRCAATVSRGVWTVELEIPFADMDYAKSLLVNCTRKGFISGTHWYAAWKNPGHFAPHFKINLAK